MKIKDAKWAMHEDDIGMRPKFRVTCGTCFRNSLIENFERAMREKSDIFEVCVNYAFSHSMRDLSEGKFDMVLREVFCSPLTNIGSKAYHNDMHYKCAKEKGCDVVKTFGVPVDKEYYDELMKRRKGKARIQPREEWEKDAGLKRQLSGLGYI